PRGQWKAPGIMPSRSSSRMSRRSTKTTSSRPSRSRASGSPIVVMRALASSTSCRNPLRIFILGNITLSVARMQPPSMPAAPRSRPLVAVAAGVLAMLLYGGQFVVSRFSLQHTLTPWDLAALRFGVAGLLCLPFLLRRGLASAAGIGWRRSLVLAITAGAPYTLILYMGLAAAPAAHGAVIIPGATPLFAAAFAWVWLGEETAPLALVGLGLILTGLVLVSWPGITGPAGDTTWEGDVLFLAAAVLWAIYTVLVRRWQVRPSRAIVMVWVLALPYLPIYWALDGGARRGHLPGALPGGRCRAGGPAALQSGHSRTRRGVRLVLHAAHPGHRRAARRPGARRDPDPGAGGRHGGGDRGDHAGGRAQRDRQRVHRRRRLIRATASSVCSREPKAVRRK